MRTEQVAIIGAGPAGLAAALQLKRLGITPVLLERTCIGGLLNNAELVVNYPGFPAGVSGPELVRLFEEQAALASVEVTRDEVVALTYDSGLFRLRTRQSLLCSKTIVIASGTSPVTLPDDLVPADALDCIYYEVRSLRDIAGAQVVIVGAGDAAFDYALTLAKRNHVTIVNRAENVKCLPSLWERAIANPHVAYLPRTRVSRIARAGDARLAIECKAPATDLCLHAHYLIGAIGRTPQLGFVAGDTRQRFSQLLARGCLHVIGDVRNGAFRQTAIAVGQGVLAGLRISRLCEERA